MSKVISLDKWRQENSPHNTGRARCLACCHEEIVVAPTGLVWMQCSECLSEKSLYVFPCERPGKHWACVCKNQFFHITPDGVYCPNCGEWQRGF